MTEFKIEAYQGKKHLSTTANITSFTDAVGQVEDMMAKITNHLNRANEACGVESSVKVSRRIDKSKDTYHITCGVYRLDMYPVGGRAFTEEELEQLRPKKLRKVKLVAEEHQTLDNICDDLLDCDGCEKVFTEKERRYYINLLKNNTITTELRFCAKCADKLFN